MVRKLTVKPHMKMASDLLDMEISKGDISDMRFEKVNAARIKWANKPALTREEFEREHGKGRTLAEDMEELSPESPLVNALRTLKEDGRLDDKQLQALKGSINTLMQIKNQHEQNAEEHATTFRGKRLLKGLTEVEDAAKPGVASSYDEMDAQRNTSHIVGKKYSPAKHADRSPEDLALQKLEKERAKSYDTKVIPAMKALASALCIDLDPVTERQGRNR